MDAEKRIIPVVEGDQGEGFKDPLDQHDLEQISELEKKLEKQLMEMNEGIKGGEDG